MTIYGGDSSAGLDILLGDVEVPLGDWQDTEPGSAA